MTDVYLLLALMIGHTFIPYTLPGLKDSTWPVVLMTSGLEVRISFTVGRAMQDTTN